MFLAIRHFFQKKPFIPDWKIPHPTNFWIADSPNSFEKLLPLADVEKMLAVNWTELILKDFSINKKITALLKKSYAHLPQISSVEYSARLDEIADKCVIRWLDQEVGWVLMLRRGKTLTEGFLSCYTGIMTQLAVDKNSSYSMREYFFSLLKVKKNDIGVDARQYGNVSRLLPFLLEQEHLANFNIDPSIENKIATANCQFQLVLLNGIPAPCVFVRETITAPPDRELLLGLNYSLAYLFKMQHANKIFKFIDKEFFLQLDPVLYPKKIIRVELEGLDYSFEVPRLRIMLAKNSHNSSFSTEGYDDEKNQHYKITVPDQDIYQAILSSPESTTVTVKPTIIPA